MLVFHLLETIMAVEHHPEDHPPYLILQGIRVIMSTLIILYSKLFVSEHHWFKNNFTLNIYIYKYTSVYL